jgi:hypothetical protein
MFRQHNIYDIYDNQVWGGRRFAYPFVYLYLFLLLWKHLKTISDGTGILILR